MTELAITVTAGAPQVDIEPGTYVVSLANLEGPRTIYPQSGPNAGKEVSIYDWTFTLDDGQEIGGTTSTASGPKSKLYAWLTALQGGRPPAVGQTFALADLIGRPALATISMNDGGWPKIENLSALPRQMLEQHLAQATGAPVAAAPQPAPGPAPVAAAAPVAKRAGAHPVAVSAPQPAHAADDLPF